MKLIALATALALPALAQDTKPAENTDVKPAQPAETAPAQLKPGEPPPPLPAPSREKENADLMKVQPGSKVQPAPDRPASLLPDSLLPSKKEQKGRPGEPLKGKSTLTPPTSTLELDQRVRYREAHNKAENDASVQALWRQSRTAQTDYEKREAMKGYYTALYKKMAVIDSSISALIEERRSSSLRRLRQTRVAPTDAPLDPQEEEQRLRLD